MKKHPEADALATRLAAAANQPPAVLAFPPVSTPEAAVDQLLPAAPESVPPSPAEEPRRKRRQKARSSTQSAEHLEDDTVPISLRPRREVLTRYVVAASERTRETGRVVSAQQMMLERLENGP